MRELSPPDFVISIAGHDKGEAFIVTQVTETRVWLVDGKRRKLGNPKIKSLKHISFAGAGPPELAQAIEQGLATDKLIRKELAIKRNTLLGRETACRKTM